MTWFLLAFVCGVQALRLVHEARLPNMTKEALEPSFFKDLHAERWKITYDSINVPSRHEKDGMKAVQSRAPLPCTDCFITWMQAGLEYADGEPANADTGMWLHHTVFGMQNKRDPMCPSKRGGERFFASGNERTSIDLCHEGTSKTGFYISPNDTIVTQTELMNLLDFEQSAFLTVTWEYVPASSVTDFGHLTPYWLDIGGCGSSEKSAKPDARFSYSSPVVKAERQGDIIMMGGHLHDGGTHIEVLKNGKVACTMDAEYVDAESGHHISHISKCLDAGSVTPGEEWSISAHYDTSLHRPMTTHDGELEPVMGIVIAYVDESHTRIAPSPAAGHRVAVVLAAVVGFGLLLGIGWLWLKRKGVRLSDLTHRLTFGKPPWHMVRPFGARRNHEYTPLVGESAYHDESD